MKRWLIAAAALVVLLSGSKGARTPIVRAPDAGGLMVPPGWWWAWLSPDEMAGYDEFQRANRGVFVVRKTWGNAAIGTAFVFEVVGRDLRWTLPGKPRPAPNKTDTTFSEMTAGAEQGIVPDAFFRFLQWASGKTWSVLTEEYERLKNPPARDPFSWPWSR